MENVKIMKNAKIMKNMKGDLLWGGVLLLWILVLGFEQSREIFIHVTSAHPYIGGFVKFAILASMGDLLGARLINNQWKIPQGLIRKGIVWGVLGMMITLVFSVYVVGTQAAQAAGRLPFEGSTLALAFFSSTIMNLTFGPMLYVYHKFGDYLIDLSIEKKMGIVQKNNIVSEFVNRVDWHAMVSFSWLITCLFIWIPAHTFVFLLPEHYRVLASAFLSILLGVIVALAKRTKSTSI